MEYIVMLLEYRDTEQHGVAGHIGDERMTEPNVAPSVGGTRGDREDKQEGIAFRAFHLTKLEHGRDFGPTDNPPEALPLCQCDRYSYGLPG
jgi:hypothetical protein